MPAPLPSRAIALRIPQTPKLLLPILSPGYRDSPDTDNIAATSPAPVALLQKYTGSEGVWHRDWVGTLRKPLLAGYDYRLVYSPPGSAPTPEVSEAPVE